MTGMSSITAATAEELYDALDGDDGTTADPDEPTVDGWQIVASTPSRTSRWHERYWLVVRNAAGETWGIEYGIGLTENQEHDLPWENCVSDRQLSLTRLYAHEVTRTEYRTKPPA